MTAIRVIAAFVWFASLLYGLGLARPLVCDAEPQLEIKHVRRASDELPTIRQSAREVPVIAQADVVVAGGGCWGAGIDADSRPPIDRDGETPRRGLCRYLRRVVPADEMMDRSAAQTAVARVVKPRKRRNLIFDVR